MIIGFGLVSLLQLLLPGLRESSGWAAAYVHARNGLYANSYFDRVVGANRLPASRRVPPVEVKTGVCDGQACALSVDNGWLHLFAIDDAGAVTRRYASGLSWEPVVQTKAELAA